MLFRVEKWRDRESDGRKEEGKKGRTRNRERLKERGKGWGIDREGKWEVGEWGEIEGESKEENYFCKL